MITRSSKTKPAKIETKAPVKSLDHDDSRPHKRKTYPSIIQHNVKNDGNCFYASIYHVLLHAKHKPMLKLTGCPLVEQDAVAWLRNKAADYIDKNPSPLKNILNLFESFYSQKHSGRFLREFEYTSTSLAPVLMEYANKKKEAATGSILSSVKGPFLASVRDAKKARWAFEPEVIAISTWLLEFGINLLIVPTRADTSRNQNTSKLMSTVAIMVDRVNTTKTKEVCILMNIGNAHYTWTSIEPYGPILPMKDLQTYITSMTRDKSQGIQVFSR